MTSWHLSSVSWIQERHYDIPFTHFQSLLKFDRFSEFVTSGDPCWPRDPFFWKAYAKSVSLIYILSYFIKVRNLTFFGDFWPWVTFFYLGWPFFRKLTPRLSFWYIVYHILSKFEIWPFFGIFDLRWPFLTSGDLFSESLRRDRHFDI